MARRAHSTQKGAGIQLCGAIFIDLQQTENVVQKSGKLLICSGAVRAKRVVHIVNILKGNVVLFVGRVGGTTSSPRFI